MNQKNLRTGSLYLIVAALPALGSHSLDLSLGEPSTAQLAAVPWTDRSAPAETCRFDPAASNQDQACRLQLASSTTLALT